MRLSPSDYSYHIYGKGLLERKIDMSNSSRVKHWGYKSREEILRRLKDCSVYIQPSTYDPVANTILESLRSGTPVLAADIEPNRELNRKFKGVVLYSQNSVDDAVDKLNYIIKHHNYFMNCAKVDGDSLKIEDASKFLIEKYNEASKVKLS